MFSSVVSGAVYGVHSYLMHIETDISDGLPMFTMVGFVSAQVREAVADALKGQVGAETSSVDVYVDALAFEEK